MLENSNRSLTNKIALIVIGILLAVSLLFAVSYAWFSSVSIDTNNTSEMLINTPFYQFVTSGNTSLSLTIDQNKFTSDNAVSNYASTSQSSAGNVNIVLKTNGASNVRCTYSIVYEPTNAYTGSTEAINEGLMEYTVGGTYYKGTSSINTLYASDVNGNSRKILYIGNLDSALDNNQEYKWSFVSRYYNVPVNQDSVIGQTISGNVKIDDINCFNYNNLNISAKDYILLNNGGKSLIESRPLNAFNYNSIGSEGTGLFAATDDDGTSYVFRGHIDNNWVKFGKDSANKDMYWRIIRINGDGTIRMIYTGVTAPAQSSSRVLTGSGTRLTVGSTYNFKFNTAQNYPRFVGFQYENNTTNIHGYGKCTTAAAASCTVNINDTDVTIYNSIPKQNLETWWGTTNLGTLYAAGQIGDAIYCNDRVAYTDNQGENLATAFGNSGQIYYASYIRNVTNKTPSLQCSEVSDRFTVNSNRGQGLVSGNGALLYPIGLVTADEVAYTGGKYSDNQGYTGMFLYSNVSYWTMTPLQSATSTSRMFGVPNTNKLNLMNIANNGTLRPVISLASTVKLSGSGRWNDPYVVVTE